MAMDGAIALLGLVLGWVKALVLIHGFHQYFAPLPFDSRSRGLAFLGFPCVDPSNDLFFPCEGCYTCYLC